MSVNSKAMVVFHRPSSYAHTDVVEVFDSLKLVAELSGKQTAYYICEPGKHYFIARAGSVSFVEATLEAGKVYDVALDVHMGWYRANIKMVPLIAGNKRRPKVLGWLANTPIYRVSAGVEQARRREAKRLKANKAAMHDFTLGEKTDRVIRMGPGDHR